MTSLLQRRGWLLRALRDTATRWRTTAAPAPAPVEGGSNHVTREAFDAWRDRVVEARGLAANAPTARWPIPADGLSRAGRGRWAFLNTLAHQIELLIELRVLMGMDATGPAALLHVLAVLGVTVEAFEEADLLYDQRESGATLRDAAVVDAAEVIGSLLRSHGELEDEHPLLDLPLRHSMEWSDTRQLLELAWVDFSTPDRLDVRGATAAITRGRLERVHILEAVVALAQADQRITRVERRIIKSAIELARLGDADSAMVWAALDEPIRVADLAAGLHHAPATRRQVFEQLIVHSYLDGDPGPREQAFLDALAEAFGITPEERLALEVSALSFLQARPDVARAFSWTARLGRWNRNLAKKTERLVRSNLESLLVEVRETGDLAQLLLRRAQGPLTPEEEQRVVAQLLDICKTIPALAIFAAPGGLLLFPILLRMLPFDLRPSAFAQDDEAEDPAPEV